MLRHRSDKVKILIAFLLAIVLNTWATLVGRGSFVHFVMVFAGLLWVIVPLTALGGLIFFIAKRKASNKLNVVAIWILILAGVLASTCVSLLFGRRLLEADIREAKSYCEALVPELDRIKLTDGSYPANLPNTGARVPRLLTGFPYYSSDGTNFLFTFPDPSGLLDGFDFQSGERKWRKFD